MGTRSAVRIALVCAALAGCTSATDGGSSSTAKSTTTSAAVATSATTVDETDVATDESVASSATETTTPATDTPETASASTEPADTEPAETVPETVDPASATFDAVGIDDTTIKISLISSDLSALSEQHLAPEIGQADEVMQGLITGINANGGVVGHQLQLTPHVLEGAAAILDPNAGRDACVKATEDDQPFAVIVSAAISADTVLCTSEYPDALTVSMDSWPQSIYDASEGRLFSVATHLSVGRQREYFAWPKILDDMGVLDGKKIGIIRTELPEQQESVDEALIPGLAALGYTDPVVSVLPCPEGSQTCAQHDVAIQRLQSAGVDFVFLVAQTLPASASVEAAASLGFTPQWTTIGNNVTDTVAQFFANAKDNFNGAIGIDAGFPTPTPEATACYDEAVANGSPTFEVGSDGYLYTAVTCLQLKALIAAIEAAAATGSVTQQSVIEAFEGLGTLPVSAGSPGTIGPGKHDLGNEVFVSRYSADTQTFEPIDNYTPIEVATSDGG
jgi:Periplasmic binding protein